MRPRSTSFTRWARWLAAFVGFPAAGVTARLAVGDIDSLGAAAVGGLVGGAVLGAVQAVVGGIVPGCRVRWTAATAAGLAAGLALGAPLIGYRTDAASLAVMGGVCGAAIGLLQAFCVPITTRDRVLWMVIVPATWAAGWLITSQVIVDADRHHAIFGSSGALAVSAVTGLLVARWSDTAVHARTTPSRPSVTAAAS